MNLIANIVDWNFPDVPGLWPVVLGAVFLACVDHVVRSRRVRAYDAWYFNLPQSGGSPDGRQPRSATAKPRA